MKINDKDLLSQHGNLYRKQALCFFPCKKEFGLEGGGRGEGGGERTTTTTTTTAIIQQLEEGESFFFLGVAIGGLCVLQRMIPHPVGMMNTNWTYRVIKK